MKTFAPWAGRSGLPAGWPARASLAGLLLLTLNIPLASAADPCKTVLCMYGRFTGNSGGSECRPAEADYFDIKKKKKHRIDWNATASARQDFLNSCPSADRGFTKKINDKFGKAGG